MKTSQMNPSRLVLALLAAGAIGGAGATAAFGGISMAASAPSAVASAAATPTAPVPSAPTPGEMCIRDREKFEVCKSDLFSRHTLLRFPIAKKL